MARCSVSTGFDGVDAEMKLRYLKVAFFWCFLVVMRCLTNQSASLVAGNFCVGSLGSEVARIKQGG